MKKKNYFDKFWEAIHLRNLLISLIVCILLLYLNENYWPKSHFLNEFIIVFIAAFAVSAYFEFYLRKGISEDNIKIYEMREELGKAGIIKYYPNFKDVDLRSFFRADVKFIDIYVHFADTVFNQISDEIYRFCEIEGNELNIYMLSTENKFICGLGELWGSNNEKYNEDGIKTKIKSAQETLISIFNQAKKEGSLKAKANLYLLKKNPVFYSFYRFDSKLIYVPSKIVEPKTIVPPAFQIIDNHNENGMFYKCLKELNTIKSEIDNNLELFYTSL